MKHLPKNVVEFLKQRAEAGAPLSAQKGRWLVFEGDYGGIIYMCVPRKFIKNMDQAVNALRLLDKGMWDIEGGVNIYVTDRSSLWGGSEGGLCFPDAVWAHPLTNTAEGRIVVEKALALIGVPKDVKIWCY